GEHHPVDAARLQAFEIARGEFDHLRHPPGAVVTGVARQRLKMAHGDDRLRRPKHVAQPVHSRLRSPARPPRPMSPARAAVTAPRDPRRTDAPYTCFVFVRSTPFRSQMDTALR